MTDRSPFAPSRRRLLRTAAAGVLAVGAGAVAGPLLAAPAQAYPWGGTLRQGASGTAVRELQIRVAGWAASSAAKVYIAVDGQFGPATFGAVERFQRAYGLAVDGVVGPNTQAKLNALAKGDGSTAHFAWSEMWDSYTSSFAGGAVSAASAQENVRRTMYKLEALRVKIGNLPIHINSGFRNKQHNADVGGIVGSMHTYGAAADMYVAGLANRVIYQHAETCGFSGLERYTIDHQHVDSQAEFGRSWWWESGVI
ncbi:muramoylpentapeptide carboxypeptidase [Actinocatenispora thailandica]|uniref:Muramoylpentapeptide carboxypeptidase n=1 Tax=Actinocatenispora thailandica TaxID=227318 RepID=A0A7R7I007_9ACTN|nr:D-Ala-D-Ala carboxypeptidase family metallohydrolase [Actinocatenispora thailandica]BCJ38823.1 muramoylpentapeptide carboxypeptidase [Actinocatenispora thailandica]